jgi:hypothetical protein
MKRFAWVPLGFLLAVGISALAVGGETNTSPTTPLLREGPRLTLAPPPTPRSTNSMPSTFVDQEGRMMSLEATRCSGAQFTIERRLTQEEIRRNKVRREIREKLKTLPDPVR